MCKQVNNFYLFLLAVGTYPRLIAGDINRNVIVKANFSAFSPNNSSILLKTSACSGDNSDSGNISHVLAAYGLRLVTTSKYSAAPFFTSAFITTRVAPV